MGFPRQTKRCLFSRQACFLFFFKEQSRAQGRCAHAHRRVKITAIITSCFLCQSIVGKFHSHQREHIGRRGGREGGRHSLCQTCPAERSTQHTATKGFPEALSYVNTTTHTHTHTHTHFDTAVTV